MISRFSILFRRRQSPVQQKIWRLAWPMILANISVPLLGFVDTAVIGHLPDSTYLAGTALGSLLITVLFWICGFLRMSTTGLVAQAVGRCDAYAVTRTLMQGMTLALSLAILILIFREPLFDLLPLLTHSSDELRLALGFAQEYFDIRIWIAPVSLISLVMTGFLIGKGQTRKVLVAVVSCNLVNLVADILFVPVLGLNVAGVAYASVLAEVTQFVILTAYVMPKANLKLWRSVQLSRGLGQVFHLNSTLFMRSALLQLCLSFMTIYASRYGQSAIAVNAILMQFFLFISFTMDGIAFALESLVGKSYGALQIWKAKLYIRRGMAMAFKLSLVYCLIYGLMYEWIVASLTSIASLRVELSQFWWCAVLMPLVSFASFIYDGVFIGLSWVKEMRNSMAIAMISYFVLVFMTLSMGNQGLWLAFLTFLMMRGVSQHWMMRHL